MQEINIHILSTRPLPDPLIEDAEISGISIDIVPFIKTESTLSVEVQQEIQLVSTEKATVVFTSMNAVDAVVNFLDGHQPDWSIYCIGTATGRLVKEYFEEEKIAGTANDAAMLASLIVEDRFVDELIFFCGDQRRDELPAILKQHEVEVNEIVVYQTIALPQKIEKPYHGILFFSPSAVQSFFQKNKAVEKTILFAIGNTTANEIKKFTTNTIITSDAPGKENLVKKMIEFFTEGNC
jgi:uroporphyrinogen-III synthase